MPPSASLTWAEDKTYPRALANLGDTNGDGLDELMMLDDFLWVLSGPFSLGPQPIAPHIVATYDNDAWIWGDEPQAGDINDDGYADIWLGNALYLGPLTGELLDRVPDAEILEPIGWNWVGNFDADGDGHEDLFLGDEQHRGVVHYGPFSGTRPGYRHDDFDISQVTYFDGGGCFDSQAEVFKLQLPSDSWALAIGRDYLNDCPAAYYLFDPSGPRGRQLTHADAFATLDSGEIWFPHGDHDGDGYGDLRYMYGNLHLGPFEGAQQASMPHFPIIAHGNEPTAYQGAVIDSPGDVDGDGRADAIVSIWSPPYSPEPRRWIDVLPAASEGLVDHRSRVLSSLEQDFCEEPLFVRVFANLDGDDQADLVFSCKDRLVIWYGRDLFP